MQHSHSCLIAFLAVTTETPAFPVAVIREGQPGEEPSPLFQFRGIQSFVEVGGKESGLGFKCWVLNDVGFISNLTPNTLLTL